MEAVKEDKSDIIVNNWPAWGFSISLILIFAFEMITAIYVEWWVFIVVNVVLGIIDGSLLKKSGLDSPNGFLLFIIPVYLWRRSTELKTSKNYFWGWMLAFIIISGIQYYYESKNLLSDAACVVVTDIAHNQLDMKEISCKAVIIDESVKGGFHQARAIMSNGNTLKIAIEERANDQIYVTIPPQ